MDRAREPAGSQATAVNQLALPAPQAETLPGYVGPSEVAQPVAPIEAAPLNGTLPAPAVPQAVEQVPSSQPLALEVAVEDLAKAHYGRGVGDGAEDTAVSKKPAAKGMRKPASAKAGTGPNASPQKGKAGSQVKSVAKPLKNLKKPSASSQQVKMKRPAAAAKKPLVKITRAESVRLFPCGCSRCRGRPGCTPSCWTKRGYKLLV